jgi:hypothetical protein
VDAPAKARHPALALGHGAALLDPREVRARHRRVGVRRVRAAVGPERLLAQGVGRAREPPARVEDEARGGAPCICRARKPSPRVVGEGSREVRVRSAGELERDRLQQSRPSPGLARPVMSAPDHEAVAGRHRRRRDRLELAAPIVAREGRLEDARRLLALDLLHVRRAIGGARAVAVEAGLRAEDLRGRARDDLVARHPVVVVAPGLGQHLARVERDPALREIARRVEVEVGLLVQRQRSPRLPDFCEVDVRAPGRAGVLEAVAQGVVLLGQVADGVELEGRDRGRGHRRLRQPLARERAQAPRAVGDRPVEVSALLHGHAVLRVVVVAQAGHACALAHQAQVVGVEGIRVLVGLDQALEAAHLGEVAPVAGLERRVLVRVEDLAAVRG